MSTEVKLDTKGLDENGESTLTWPELTRHMASAEVLFLFHSACAGSILDPARLSIRRDGTYAVFSERDSDFGQTISSIADLIDAMTVSSVDPGDTAAIQLKKAEMEFDADTLKRIKRTVLDACRSEEIEFQASTGDREIKIRLPHRSTLQAEQKQGDPALGGDKDKIERIRTYVDTVSISGLGTLITRQNTTPAIKAGDKIIVKLCKSAKRFFRLKDTDPARSPDREQRR